MEIYAAFLPGYDPASRLIRVNCAADRIGCSHRTVRRWIREGKLRAQRVGRRAWGVYWVDVEFLCNLGRP